MHMNSSLNERSRQLLDEIKRRTQTTAYVLAFDSESTPTIFDSKVGGLPYWDPAKTYPTDSNGKKMFLLAQINFDQDKAESPLPQGGMLQFFVGDDEMYGLDFDHPSEQKKLADCLSRKDRCECDGRSGGSDGHPCTS